MPCNECTMIYLTQDKKSNLAKVLTYYTYLESLWLKSLYGYLHEVIIVVIEIIISPDIVLCIVGCFVNVTEKPKICEHHPFYIYKTALPFNFFHFLKIGKGYSSDIL